MLRKFFSFGYATQEWGNVGQHTHELSQLNSSLDTTTIKVIYSTYWVYFTPPCLNAYNLKTPTEESVPSPPP